MTAQKWSDPADASPIWAAVPGKATQFEFAHCLAAEAVSGLSQRTDCRSIVCSKLLRKTQHQNDTLSQGMKKISNIKCL